jgi:hypothetical protein
LKRTERVPVLCPAAGAVNRAAATVDDESAVQSDGGLAAGMLVSSCQEYYRLQEVSI